MKKKVVGILFLVIVMLAFFIKGIPVLKQEIYVHEVSKLVQVNKMPTKATRIVFVGRKTCPYCQKFMISNFFHNEIGRGTYYLNTDRLSTKEKLDLLIKYKIDSVPSLIKLKNGKVVYIKHDYSQLRGN